MSLSRTFGYSLSRYTQTYKIHYCILYESVTQCDYCSEYNAVLFGSYMTENRDLTYVYKHNLSNKMCRVFNLTKTQENIAWKCSYKGYIVKWV